MANSMPVLDTLELPAIDLADKLYSLLMLPIPAISSTLFSQAGESFSEKRFLIGIWPKGKFDDC
jgi:hypothetical protein